MPLRKGYKQLLAEAASRITTLSPGQAREFYEGQDTVFVDLRDLRELEREGMIPGAFHAPRGMLEFWVDPESPYYKEIFGSGKRFVFYCQSLQKDATNPRLQLNENSSLIKIDEFALGSILAGFE